MQDLLTESAQPAHLFAYGSVTSEMPNKELYQYTGKVEISREAYALTAN